ncbi:MAG: VTT domain-containing protein [Firmicutes bacterium]|nr:VTT domain-containing protein [Bacillota bacterium]
MSQSRGKGGTQQAPWQRVALLVVAVSIVVIAISWLYRSGVLWRLPDLVRSCGVYGLLISYAAIVLQTFIPFAPFALLAGGNALVHGFWLGYISTWAGAFTGALLLYVIARRTLYGPLKIWLERFLRKHPKVEHVRARIEKERGWSVFGFIVLLRLQPWLPSSAVDIASGMARVSFGPFAIATVVGQGPMIALESYVGHRLLNPAGHTKELWAIGGVSLLLLCLYGLWQWRKRRDVHR